MTLPSPQVVLFCFSVGLSAQCHMRITNHTSDLLGWAKCKPVRCSGNSCSQVWCFWHRVVFSKMYAPLLFGPLPVSFIRFVAVTERWNGRLWPVELWNAGYCCPRLGLGDAKRWSPSDGSALFPVSTRGGSGRYLGWTLLWLACLCSTLLKSRDPTVVWTTTVFFPHISPKLYHSEWTCHTPLLHRPRNWLFFRGAAAQCGLWPSHSRGFYEGWNFNSGNYLFTTDTK